MQLEHAKVLIDDQDRPLSLTEVLVQEQCEKRQL